MMITIYIQTIPSPLETNIVNSNGLRGKKGASTSTKQDKEKSLEPVQLRGVIKTLLAMCHRKSIKY